MVGKNCTVCKNASYINKRLSFFSYPSDPQRRYEWLKAVDRLDLLDKLENNKTRGSHRICEAHFEEKYIRRSTVNEGRKFLSKDAFPTLFLDERIVDSVMVSMNHENLVKPPELLYNDGNDKEYTCQTFEVPIIDDMDIPSPQPCPDISEFCESVIKVSKGTQTGVWSGGQLQNNKRKLVITNEDDIKKRKTSVFQFPTGSNTKELFLQMCFKFLPDNISKILKWHIDYKQHSDNSNLFALNLYYAGANSYNFLKDALSLPSVDSLRHFLVPKSTKLSDTLLNALKSKVNNMSNRERICSISVGSISLKANLYYKIKYDRIIGFHDVNGVQNIEPAKYAIVLMVQGIIENWRQPIGYSFISEYENYPEISLWIDEVITVLLDIGLDIRTFVSDSRSEFLYMSKSRDVSSEKTYFSLNGKKIYYIYDTTQLLKVIRNNSKSCDFHYNGEASKMDELKGFSEKLNDLYCFLNTRSRFSKSPYKKAFSNKKYQKDFMDDMLSLFQNLKVVRKVDRIDVTENMKFIDGFQITIKSVMQLFNDLNSKGVKFLFTSRLSHNSLNTLFKRVKESKEKESSKEECTGKQFNSCFVRSFVFNMLKRPLGAIRNSPENSLEFEKFSQQLLDEENSDKTQSMFNKPLQVSATDYRQGLPDKNAFVYVCGYLYLKCLQRHHCKTLKAYFKHSKESEDKDDATYVCSVSVQLNVKKCKISPPDNFTEFLMLLERKFKEFFKPNLQICSVGQELLRELDDCEFEMPCPCFPIDYLKALFIRVRLFYTIKKNNRILKKRKGVKVFRVSSL